MSGLSLSLGNSGDWVALSNASSQIDSVAWENEISGWNIAARHESIYRVESNDTNKVSDWSVSASETAGYGSLIKQCDNPDSGEINHPHSYSDASGLSGTNLKAALQSIVSAGHAKQSYGQVWDSLQYTDEDPNNSPNMILFYTGSSHSKNDRDGQPGFDNDSWDREYVWAKSLGFPSKSQLSYTDLHHLKPTDKSVNASRSNKDFDSGGSPVSEVSDTFSDSNSWEPRDSIKGDVARMIFYMDMRYDGSDSDMPDLMIVHHANTSSGEPKIGVLCTLYEWRYYDLVDSFESRRNDRIEQLQGNRNPFIDNPQWIESIWGSQCN